MGDLDDSLSDLARILQMSRSLVRRVRSSNEQTAVLLHRTSLAVAASLTLIRRSDEFVSASTPIRPYSKWR